MRAIYDMVLLEGISLTKIETIAVTNSGRRLFIGTNDGSLLLYEVRPNNDDKCNYICIQLCNYICN